MKSCWRAGSETDLFIYLFIYLFISKIQQKYNVSRKSGEVTLEKLLEA